MNRRLLQGHGWVCRRKVSSFINLTEIKIMNPEQGPKVPESSAHEEPLDIEVPEEGGVSDEEHKSMVLRNLQEEKAAYSRELADWQQAYDEAKAKSGGLSEEQEKQYQERIQSLREKIALAAKDKRKAEEQFEAYEKRQAA